MKRRLNKIIAAVVLIVVSPLLIIESIIKRPTDIVGRVTVTFQVLLFLVELGNQNN
jgi:hypothetical protein